MRIDDITELVTGLGDVVLLEPGPGDGSPEISWGDVFFYYAPDGAVKGQPFATVVTKDYPDDEGSRLDRPGAFRLNVAADADDFRRYVGRDRHEPGVAGTDHSAVDTVFAHPVYGHLGWLAVVNPGPATDDTVRQLLRSAHGRARNRYERAAATTRD